MRAGWLRTSVLLVLALGLGRWINATYSTEQLSGDPFIRDARVGTTVELRYADVTADEVRFAQELRIAGLPSVRTTGTFVLVDLTVRARTEPMRIGGLQIQTDDGREYWPSSRLSCYPGVAPTGLDWHATACFELPTRALAGAVLLVARGAIPEGAHRRDDVARVNLGISQVAEDAVGSRDPVSVVAVRGSFDEPDRREQPLEEVTR